MTILGQTSGVFSSSKVGTKDGRGIQIKLPRGSKIGDSSIVTGFQVRQMENIGLSQCLSGGVFMYAFGNDPSRGSFSVTVASFLNMCNGGGFKAVDNAIKNYRNGRVSVSKKPAYLTMGKNCSLSGYIIGQDIAGEDPELGVVSVTYNMISPNTH